MKAVIFDMDGVLIDSEPVMRKSAILALEDYGIKACDDDFYPFTGRGEDIFVGGVAEKHGVKYIPEMKARAYEIYTRIVDREAGFFEGIPETIEKLHSLGYALAVASAADSIKVIANIRAAGIPREHLGAVVTGEDVSVKKPAPDAFLEAAKRLGARPEECVVIEDAPSGLKAAQNAGRNCIGITSTFSADELKAAGADRTAEKTMMIVPLIKELLP